MSRVRVVRGLQLFTLGQSGVQIGLYSRLLLSETNYRNQLLDNSKMMILTLVQFDVDTSLSMARRKKYPNIPIFGLR